MICTLALADTRRCCRVQDPRLLWRCRRSLVWRILLGCLAAVGCGNAVGSVFAAALYHDPLFGVQSMDNIVYGTSPIDGGASTKNLLLKVYEPTDIGIAPPASRPTVLFIHGGGFVRGSKSDFSQAPVWASYGYNVISIDYRLLGDNPPPMPGPIAGLPWGPAMDNEVNAAIADAAKALQWTFNNAAAYGIDTHRIGIAGVSAGAIISLATAYLAPPPGETPKVVLDLMGAMFGRQSAIESGAPPAFVVHGTIDRTLPFTDDQSLVDRLNALGIYNQFHVEQGIGHHLDWNLMLGNKTLSQCATDFLADRLATVPEPSTALLLALGGAGCASVALRRRSRGMKEPSGVSTARHSRAGYRVLRGQTNRGDWREDRESGPKTAHPGDRAIGNHQ